MDLDNDQSTTIRRFCVHGEQVRAIRLLTTRLTAIRVRYHSSPHTTETSSNKARARAPLFHQGPLGICDIVHRPAIQPAIELVNSRSQLQLPWENQAFAILD